MLFLFLSANVILCDKIYVILASFYFIIKLHKIYFLKMLQRSHNP